MAPVRDLTARRSGGTKGHLPPLILLGSNDPTSRNILCPRAGPLYPVGHTGDPLRRRLVAPGTGRQSGGRQLGWPFPRRPEPHACVQSLIGLGGLGFPPPPRPQNTRRPLLERLFFCPQYCPPINIGAAALRKGPAFLDRDRGIPLRPANTKGSGLLPGQPPPIPPHRQRKGRDQPGLFYCLSLPREKLIFPRSAWPGRPGILPPGRSGSGTGRPPQAGTNRRRWR